MAKGYLIINVYADNIAQPVKNALVTIKGKNYLQNFKTDENGKTITIELDAPDEKYSQTEQESTKPYSEYEVTAIKKGLQTTIIKGVEIFPNETSIQKIYMSSNYTDDEITSTTELPEHNLWGNYPPKIPESPIKFEEQDNNIRVLPSVLIPEYVIIHNGIPTNTNVSNYNVDFTDYIKNVASSEIYSTWPIETIKANVHAIVSFTLNRIFTEWYRTKGHNFTITATPQYDQSYTHNRTIFKSIADIVDQTFDYYIKLPNVTQPFLAQYNDGIKTNNPGWLSQWGSKDLGDKGYSALSILKHYYTNNLTLEQAEETEGLPTSFPGYNLKLGSCGEPVQKIQNMLNTINGNYPGIPKILPADGQFKENTESSVKTFQKVFDLTSDGIVNFATWYKIVYVYVAVSKMLQGIIN